jgi:hypothetical protein
MDAHGMVDCVTWCKSAHTLIDFRMIKLRGIERGWPKGSIEKDGNK